MFIRQRSARIRVISVLMFSIALGAVGLNGTEGADAATQAYVGAAKVSLAAGSGHTCVLMSTSEVKCWGENGYGQLGNGSTTNSSAAVSVVKEIGTTLAQATLVGAVALTAGDKHSCALLGDGGARCWGDNSVGQLGIGTAADSLSPVRISALTNVVSMAAGSNHTCAVNGGREVFCWGENGYGQLGSGSRTDSLLPVKVPGIADAIGVSAGSDFTCVLREGGFVSCWGDNSEGQLGNGTRNASVTPVAVQSKVGINPPQAVSGAATIATGGNHACALLVAGTALCWGGNGAGQLGTGTFSGSAFALSVSGFTKGIAISAGENFTCAILDAGSAKCWGANSAGQLGNGSSVSSAVSSVVPTGIGQAVAIAAGSAHMCVLRADGNVLCKGDNAFGQATDQSLAASVPPGSFIAVNRVAVDAGQSHTCALRSNGSVQCFGSNLYGQLGAPTTSIGQQVVVYLGGIPAVAISAGTDHSCAVLVDGSARCWGRNTEGQLGNGTLTNSTASVTVTGVTAAASVVSGGGSTCVLYADGTVGCWGRNGLGQLGNATNVSSSTVVGVSGLSGVTALTAGSDHICAAKVEGEVWCWGGNARGQLGDGSTTSSNVPVRVSGIDNAVGVAAGATHTCAVLVDGSGRCWGENGAGQLGNGTSSAVPVSSPTVVAGISASVRLVAVAAGGSHTCALMSDGNGKCWGANSSGQFGNGTTTSASVPSPTLNPFIATNPGAGVTSLTAGASFTCLVMADSRTFCAGSNASGQFGKATPVTSMYPTFVPVT